MRKFYATGILLAGMLLSAVSCQDKVNDLSPKAQVEETKTSLQDVRLVNGRLKFASREAYETTLNQLKSLTADELSAWEKNNLPNFTSMRTAYYSLTTADMEKIAGQNSNAGYEGFLTLIGTGEDREAVMNVDAGFVGTLINKDGLVQIGDEIVKVGYNQSKSVVNVSEDELQKLVASGWKGAGNGAIKTYQVQRTISSVASGRVKDREATCEDRYKDDRRFRAELWETNQPPAYSGVGGRAKHQNRFLRVWWADNAPQIQLQINGTFTQEGVYSQAVNYDSGVRYNQNIIEWNFEQCFNFSCIFDYSSGTTVRSSGIGDTGGSEGCTATGY